MDSFERFKNFIINYKINFIMGLIVIIFVVFSNVCIYLLLSKEKDNKSNIGNHIIEKSTINEEVIEEEKKLNKFDIKGAVNNPGVYELEEGARIIDAIEIAGGLKDTADTSVNNLSKYILDQMVIVIYTYDEVSKFTEVKNEEKTEINECPKYNIEIKNDSCIKLEEDKINTDEIASEVDIKISLNKATIDLLMTIPGIGESKANNIIEYRNEFGDFKAIEEIMNVSGIGESLFEKIKDYITI